MKKLFLLAMPLIAVLGWADDLIPQNIGPFCGLNNQDNSLVIPACNAQDLLNVDITPGGRSVKRRRGYGLDATLSISTSAVHGGYHFYDANGNDFRLWANDTDISSSKNSAAYTLIVTSMTDNSTVQCTDSQGFAWCTTSNRDFLLKTDGTNLTWYTSPLGTMVTAGPDRLVVGNVSGDQNTLYFSASGDFTTFTTGNQPSSAFHESILAPGSHLTHIRYSNGRYLWWKDQSFGYVLVQDQFNVQIVIVSYLVGTLDNSSVENEGIVYFRGQDNHIWAYDGSGLTRLTREITPTVNAANSRRSNSWLQTSQSDFNGGSIVPTGRLSTSISVGDVIVSSFSDTENSSAQWNNGTNSNVTVSASSMAMTVNSSINVNDPSFEGSPANSWTAGGSWIRNTGLTIDGCTITPQDGSWMYVNQGGNSGTAQLFDPISNTVVASLTIQTNNPCTWVDRSITASGVKGQRVQLRFVDTNGDVLNTTATYVVGGSAVHFVSNNTTSSLFIDNVGNGSNSFSSINSGYFTSQVINTSFSSSTIQLQTTVSSPNENITYQVKTATASTGPWTSLLTSSNTNAVGNQYVIYTSSFTDGISALQSATLLARSTGTYYSAVNNAPNLTSWDVLQVHDSQPGNSAITYYTRSSTNTFTVLSSTPSWVAQTKGATVSASTGTYFQLRADFALTAATETPTLNDFTFNWFEGNAADKAYMTYFDYGIWVAISTGSATANNVVLRYDLINQTWTLYSMPVNGFLTQNAKLYIGDSGTGKTYRFSASDNDNGSAINAYWQSKDFAAVGTGGPTGVLGYNPMDSPFIKKDYRISNTFIASQTTGSLSVTYSLDRGAGTTYSFSMNDPNGLSTTHSNYYLPVGTKGYAINLKFGNNAADQPWELFGAQLQYMPGKWQPYP